MEKIKVTQGMNFQDKHIKKGRGRRNERKWNIYGQYKYMDKDWLGKKIYVSQLGALCRDNITITFLIRTLSLISPYCQFSSCVYQIPCTNFIFSIHLFCSYLVYYISFYCLHIVFLRYSRKERKKRKKKNIR